MAKRKGKGSLKHQLLQRFLADYFRRRDKVAIIEGFIGKNVDILLYDASKTIAVEIQLSSKHCLQIKRDYELGCDQVWIVCDSTEVLNNIKNKLRYKLDKTLFDKTKFYLVKNFLPLVNNKNNTTTRNKITEENSGIKTD